ncbi:spore cortex biosynthesis protein YabQ [Halalkalibacter nanhaiisediminis]|uniref:Spore cortex biosynthesis protein YabQ n=1 Tax=Halalkalibacter nanhaiisediminis TaxID=688079 RepID=A0A562Q925_9BACI|nr:spore cortex biosynthesis protein YabQ [Halalkalibacter nanhaiisediminis]TWI53219.1 spore cortex biosynthesis protein YabQ [Halalkalibacter nanhaiisediminis]
MSLTIQLYTMLSMAAMGVYIGAAIDTYSRFTKKRKTFHFLVACNDLMFWLIQALVVFYVLLQSNHGDIRFYIFLALICGYAAYQALFRRIYQTLLERFIQFVIHMYRFIVKLIILFFVKPIKFILKLLYSLCMMVVTGCLTVLLFFIRLVLKPIYFVFSLFYKWTGLHKQVEKIKPILRKIKDFISSMKKRKE